MLFKQVIGNGRTADEALLYARINQLGYDKKIKYGTVSTKTEIYEIPIDNFRISCDKIISALHKGHYYYRYIMNHKTMDMRRFTETEYSYYIMLISRLTKAILHKIYGIYETQKGSVALGIKYDENIYKIMY